MRTYLLKESSGEVVTEIVCADRERAIELAREYKLLRDGDGRYLTEWQAFSLKNDSKVEIVTPA